MACILALILAATVLTVPTGNNNKLLANAARTSPAEAFWRAALPGAPMPEAIRELLHSHAGDEATTVLNKDDVKLKDGGDDPPPMNFNYDDYRLASSRRRNENTAPPSAEVLKHAADDSAQNAVITVVFLEDAARVSRAAALDPPRLYTVLEGGSTFVVCHRENDNDAAVAYLCRANEAGGCGNDESPPVSP